MKHIIWLFFIATSIIHADSLVTVNAQNVLTQNGSTVNLSMELDLTSLSVLSDSATVLIPQMTYVSDTITVIPAHVEDMILIGEYFPSAIDGDFLFRSLDGSAQLQIGDYDYTYAFFPGLEFPQPGSYQPALLNDGYRNPSGNYGYYQGVSGSITVTDPPDPNDVPEPPTLSLIGLSCSLLLVCRLLSSTDRKH